MLSLKEAFEQGIPFCISTEDKLYKYFLIPVPTPVESVLYVYKTETYNTPTDFAYPYEKLEFVGYYCKTNHTLFEFSYLHFYIGKDELKDVTRLEFSSKYGKDTSTSKVGEELPDIIPCFSSFLKSII